MSQEPAPRSRSWAAIICGWLLAAMALGQIASFPSFVDILRDYEVVGAGAPVLAVVLVLAEAGGAAGLLTFRRAPAWVGRLGGALALTAAVVWSALAVQAFARGLSVPNCGCFGRFVGQELRWWVLLQDSYFLVLAWLAAVGAGLGLPMPRRRARPAETESLQPAPAR